MNFRSWRDFHEFDEEVKHQNRYIYSERVKGFLENVCRTLPDRSRRLKKGSILYRAQIGYDEFDTGDGPNIMGFSAQRMKPIPYKGREGRGNPKGISHLYLSDDENTALAELRPHLGQYLSSAQFKIKRDLVVVDCYSVPIHYSFPRCIFDPPQSQRDIGYAVWSMINEAFTKPVTNADDASDYVSTQILAELFKSEGFDGVCFKSSLGHGYNFMLFNMDDADLNNCTVMETKKIEYFFEECANRYFSQNQ